MNYNQETNSYTLNDGQELIFIKYKDGVKIIEGTTNEELFELLIDRYTRLNDILPCAENINIIAHLGLALSIQNGRMLKRKEQNVETTDVPHR